MPNEVQELGAIKNELYKLSEKVGELSLSIIAIAESNNQLALATSELVVKVLGESKKEARPLNLHRVGT